MVLETAGGAGDRVTDYKSRARTGVSGVTGGHKSSGTGEEQYRGHASITGRGSGTGGTQETTLGRSHALATTGGNGGGYDRGHASATSTTIPTSTVTREYVSEPGIKESNTNVEFYMTGPGGGSGIGTGTISGIGTGTGSGTRTRTYTAGDSSAIKERTGESVVHRGENLSTGKGVDHGARKYTIGDGATAARMAGDIGTSSHGKGVGHSSTGPRTGEDSFVSRTDSGGLSYLKDTATSLGLGAAVGDGERSHVSGEDPSVTRTVGKSYNGGSAPGARPTHGSGTGTRRYTIGGDTYSIRVPRGDPSVNKTSNLTSTAGGAMGDLSSRSREDSRRAASIASTGGRRASHTGTRDQSSTLSYIKDVVSDLHIGPGSSTGAHTGKDEQTYASGDNSSTTIGDSGTFVTGRDSTPPKVGAIPRPYTPGGGTSTTRAGDTSSYTKDTGIGTDTTPRRYDIGSGSGFGSGNTYGQGSHDYTTGRDSPSVMKAMANTSHVPYSKDFAPSPHPTPGTYADAPPTVETKSGAYMPDHQDKETRSMGNLDGSGKMQMGRYTIIHPIKATESQTGTEKRMEQEAGSTQRVGRGREHPGQQDMRHITGGYWGMGEMAADHGRREGETRTVQEYSSQPWSSVRDDASAKHDRIRLDLEQEALIISRGKDAASSTAGSGQKYSSLVSEHQEPIERKRIREDMARESSRDITPSREIQETRIPGDFDFQERYDRDIAVGEAEPSVRSRAQEARDEVANTSSQIQLETPPPTVPNLEQQQQQETYEREVEKAARESSMERHRTADLARTGSGPGGMKTTMRDSPEYKEQKASGIGQATANEKGVGDERGVMESRSEGDDDDGARKGIFERAADKMGNLLKT